MTERTPEQNEISKAWETLESFGFPPEAIGWPFNPVDGLLPEAIECALQCLIRQRESLLAELKPLRIAQTQNQGEPFT